MSEKRNRVQFDFLVESKSKIINKDENKRKYIDLVFVDIVNSYQRVLSHCANIAKIFGTDKTYTYTEEEEMRFYELRNRY